MWLSNFVDIGKECTFCNNCEESLNHLFVDYNTECEINDLLR